MPTYCGQWFSRWHSSSITLHILHISLIVPLKFLPHSSIPYLDMMIVLVSCLELLTMSGRGSRWKFGWLTWLIVDAVLVFSVLTSPSVLCKLSIRRSLWLDSMAFLTFLVHSVLLSQFISSRLVGKLWLARVFMMALPHPIPFSVVWVRAILVQWCVGLCKTLHR